MANRSKQTFTFNKAVYQLLLSMQLIGYLLLALCLAFVVTYCSLDISARDLWLQLMVSSNSALIVLAGVTIVLFCCLIVLFLFYPLSNFLWKIKKIHYIQGKHKKISIEEAVGNFVSSYGTLTRKLHLHESSTLLLYENALLLSSKIETRELLSNFVANLCSYDKRWVVGHVYCFDHKEDEYRQEVTYADTRFRNIAPVIHATFSNIFSNSYQKITDELLRQSMDCQIVVYNDIAHSLNQYYSNKVKELKINSLLRFPILLDGKIYAVVELLAKRPIKLHQEYINMVNVISRQLSFTLSEINDVYLHKKFQVL